MLMHVDLDRLRTFWAVATENSFSRAAEKLFRTQSAVSQSIRLLEREIGETLFVRLGRTIDLTPAGRILLSHVEESFGILERGRARINALRALREGEVVIAASDTLTRYTLPATLRQFRKKYPGVEVRIRNRPSFQAADLVAVRQADLGIVTLPIDHPKLFVEPLLKREDVAICSSTHAFAKRSSVRLCDLAALPLILLDRGATTRAFIDACMNAAGLKPRIAMELGSIEVIKRMVELDFGVSIVPRIAVQDEVARSTLHAIRVFKQSEWRDIGLVYPKTGVTNVAADAFIAVLKRAIEASRRSR